MKHYFFGLLGLLALGTIADALGAMTPDQVAALPPPAGRTVDFKRDIKPILETSCLKCHGRGRDKGGFLIDTRDTLLKGGDSGPAAVAGHSQESLLIELVAGVNPDSVMPRKGSRLTGEQVGLLRAWIDQGLTWDPQITFGRPAPLNLLPPADLPALSSTENVNLVDQTLADYFKSIRFQPPAVVSDRIFARRIYLDLVGLLPTAAELQAFEKDPARDKRQKLAHQLLERNEAYAAHWLSFWNDLLRNDYRGTGYIDGGRKQITSWLYSALVNNLPYDQFVSQLIDPAPGAEGFTRGIIWRGVVNSSQSQPLQAAQNISQVFMGVNLKCASCHDSFINDWRLSDAYGLAAIYSDNPLELVHCDRPTGKMANARFIYPELGEIDGAQEKSARLKRLAEIVAGPKNGRLSRTVVNRLWARFFGRALVEPVDDMDQPAWHQPLLDGLAADLVAHHYDLKQTMERIVTSRAYQYPAIDQGEAAGKNFVFHGPSLRRLSAEQFRDAVGQLTGVWQEKSEFAAVTNHVRAGFVAADALTTALGRPNRDQVNTSRASAATTLQALELTHGQVLNQVLNAGAEKLAAGNPAPDALIDRVYQDALGRKPTRPERKLAANLLGRPVNKEGVADLLWAMTMLPEFQLIP